MSIVLLVAALAALLALTFWLLRARDRHPDDRPIEALDTVQAWAPRATRVLDAEERKAYDLLRHALPAQMILAQVPLQRFVKVPTRNSYAEWLRRVGQLHADFVVCDSHSQVVAVVEIQAADEAPGSRSHRRRERMLRVLKAAQVPVHVWRAGVLPSVGATRQAILPPPEVPRLADEPERAGPADADTAPLREPPPSTWFDDFDSGPIPLASERSRVPR